MKHDCIFCAIIARQAPAQIVAETDDVLVIKDIAPKASIHYLIMPKHHYRDLQELDDCCVGSRLLQMAKKLSSETPDAKDYRLMINNGEAVGQRVFHLHMHFLAGSRLPEFGV
jgi:diadenosine tetraphosphate (Ap4A) HIT family hydrolase